MIDAKVRHLVGELMTCFQTKAYEMPRLWKGMVDNYVIEELIEYSSSSLSCPRFDDIENCVQEAPQFMVTLDY